MAVSRSKNVRQAAKSSFEAIGYRHVACTVFEEFVQCEFTDVAPQTCAERSVFLEFSRAPSDESGELDAAASRALVESRDVHAIILRMPC